ncbi:MAG: hypothetical protein RBR97_16340 [Bacteroidales bacterium]|nr:hypothetical protein [Bacteroidales bacterium]
MKKSILFSIPILLFSFITNAQFYIDYNLGYDFSLSQFKKDIVLSGGYPYQESENPPTWEDISNPFFQEDYQERTKTIQFLPIGSGMDHSISFGYKSNSIFTILMTIGLNASSLQFSDNTISHFYSAEPIVRVYTDTTWLPPYDTQFFDQYLNVVTSISEELKYSYYYFSPGFSVNKQINKFEFEIFSGIAFYFFRLQSTYIIDSDMHSASMTARTIIKKTKQMSNSSPIISYNLGIQSSYSITDKLALLFQIKYAPVKYQPTSCFATETVLNTDNNNNTTSDSRTYENQPLTYEDMKIEDPYRISIYNFQSLNVSIGLRYFFMSQNNNR